MRRGKKTSLAWGHGLTILPGSAALWPVALVVAVLLGLGASANAQPPRPAPRIISQHPHFEELVPTGTTVELLASGFSWVEGPAWHREGGYLLFSDIPENSVFRWQPGGEAALYLWPSGYSGTEPFAGREPGSNGLVIDEHGRLVLCEHGNRRITRLETDGSRTVLVDRFEGKRLNSPNDAVFHSNGDLYFTDPSLRLAGRLR